MINKGTFPSDPKGLIFEAYKIDGISGPECRSIFLDWALGLDQKYNPLNEINDYINYYEKMYPNHPMNEVLYEGLQVQPRRGLRRLRKSRFAKDS